MIGGVRRHLRSSVSPSRIAQQDGRHASEDVGLIGIGLTLASAPTDPTVAEHVQRHPRLDLVADVPTMLVKRAIPGDGISRHS